MGTSQRTSAGTAILVDRNDGPIRQRGQDPGRRKGSIHNPPPSKQLWANYSQHVRLKNVQKQGPLVEKDQRGQFHDRPHHNWKGLQSLRRDGNQRNGRAKGNAQERINHLASTDPSVRPHRRLDPWQLQEDVQEGIYVWQWEKGPGVGRLQDWQIPCLPRAGGQGGRIEAAPSIRRISDHSPLVLTIWGRTSVPPTPATYFDIALLKEEESMLAFLDAWTGTQPMPS